MNAAFCYVERWLQAFLTSRMGKLKENKCYLLCRTEATTNVVGVDGDHLTLALF